MHDRRWKFDVPMFTGVLRLNWKSSHTNLDFRFVLKVFEELHHIFLLKLRHPTSHSHKILLFTSHPRSEIHEAHEKAQSKPWLHEVSVSHEFQRFFSVLYSS